MSRDDLNLHSVLSEAMARFYDSWETAGMRVDKLVYTLREFDKLAVELDLKAPVITREFFEAWLAEHRSDKSKTLGNKTCVLRGLASFIIEHGGESYLPPVIKGSNSPFTPHIFSPEELGKLMEASSKLEMFDGNMNTGLFCFPALLRTLAGAGPRIEETLSINNADVHIDERFILLRKTKNRKERVLPLSKSLAECLAQYVKYRDRLPVKGIDAPESPFFVKANGMRPSRQGVYQWFRSILVKCDIPFIGDHKGPRLHDFRHTFAVMSLRQMTRNGLDVYASLPILSTCLGHASIGSTEDYVRLTIDAYPELEDALSDTDEYIYPKLGEGLSDE